MKKVFVNKIKKILDNQMTELNNKPGPDLNVDFDGDETDEIQGNMIVSLNSHLSSRDKEKISAIKSALKKIEENTFGICESCEEKISEKRLEANPFCKNCIFCQDKIEIEAKRSRRL